MKNLVVVGWSVFGCLGVILGGGLCPCNFDTCLKKYGQVKTQVLVVIAGGACSLKVCLHYLVHAG